MVWTAFVTSFQLLVPSFPFCTLFLVFGAVVPFFGTVEHRPKPPFCDPRTYGNFQFLVRRAHDINYLEPGNLCQGKRSVDCRGRCIPPSGRQLFHFSRGPRRHETVITDSSGGAPDRATNFTSLFQVPQSAPDPLFKASKSGQVRPRQGTEICNFGAPSPLEALHWIFCFLSSIYVQFSKTSP